MASEKTVKTVDTRVAVKEALKELKDNNLIEDLKTHEAQIIEVLRKAVETEEKLSKEMIHMVDKRPVEVVEKKMSAVIGQDRVNLIKKAFEIETYRMKLVKKSDGKSVVQVHRGEAEFRPEIRLMSIQDVELAEGLQWSSIVVEVFMFVLSCAGVRVDLNTDEIRAVTNEVEHIIRQPQFFKALLKFNSEWKKESTWERAKAIFFLLKDSKALGFFWKIVNLLFISLSKWQKAKDVAECSAIIVVAFGTGGAALISKIALAVNSAFGLIVKLGNISQFAEYKKTL